MSDLRPGIHKGLPFGEYLAIDAANASTLKTFARSAAHARHEITHPSPPTEALDFGQAVHCCVLEPAEFKRRYTFGPRVDRRTKEGKAAWSAFEAEAGDREVMRQEDFAACLSIAEAVNAHATAREFLSAPGSNEVSVLWVDEGPGVLCKARCDRICSHGGWTWVVDLKTSVSADPTEWGRHCAKYGYHEQAAWYLDGLATLAPATRRFVHIVAEKEEPFAVSVCELDEEAIDQGRKLYRRHLALYAQCRESGVWPGYPEGIHPTKLPAWAIAFDGEGAEL